MLDDGHGAAGVLAPQRERDGAVAEVGQAKPGGAAGPHPRSMRLIDGGPGEGDAGPMELPAASTLARWAADVRGEGRAVRVAAHVDAGFLVLSTWKADVCVGTVRLVPQEASELIAGLAECLASLARDRSVHAAEGLSPPPRR